MKSLCTRKSAEKGCWWQSLSVWWALALLAAGSSQSQCVAQPVLSVSVPPINPYYAHVTLSNCSDTNFHYVTQTSTDLVHWVSVATNQAATTNIPLLVRNNYGRAFFRVGANFLPSSPFPFAIETVNAFNENGNNITVDSFDSSSTLYSTNGQYSTLYRKAGGNVLATGGITNSLFIGNTHIYGHVYTGPGTTIAADVQVGTHGAVGDIAWNASDTNVEPGYWMGGFRTSFPDVPAPVFAGNALPAPQTNGMFAGEIVLTGGNYTTTNGTLNGPLVITAGLVNLWVQGSLTLPGITFTNGGVLNMFIGTTSGSGDTLSFGENGSLNSPGYAANLVILGLPSLNSISLSRSGTYVGLIYAPNAIFSARGGGAGALDMAGSFIFNSINLKGNCNFHFDESLLVNGPGH